MAHFARVENNIVCDVIVVANDALDGESFPESELLGQQVLAESGFSGTFLQCSYNGTFRGSYPAIGWIYDPNTDTFQPASTPEEA